MVRGIKTFKRRRGPRKHQFRIGFERTALARDLNNHTIPLPLHRLALLLEKGSVSQNLPARETWTPQLAVIRARAALLRLRLRRDIIREARRRDPRIRPFTRVR
jgi:hypothetical protein